MRARSVKPAFFKNEDLATLPFEARLLFIGLWCMADREGRMEDRPQRLRVELFPYESEINIEAILNQLSPKFIERYETSGRKYIQVMKFLKHQNPHYKEPPSEIPKPRGHKDSKYIGSGVPESIRQHVFGRDGFKCKSCGSTTDLTIDHIKPRVLGGSNFADNLQCLCKKCNSSKNNRILSQHRVNDKSKSTQSSTLTPDSPSLTPDAFDVDSLNRETDSVDLVSGKSKSTSSLALLGATAGHGKKCVCEECFAKVGR